jgi:hypothetical protein
LDLTENQGEPIRDRRRVTKFAPLKGPVTYMEARERRRRYVVGGEPRRVGEKSWAWVVGMWLMMRAKIEKKYQERRKGLGLMGAPRGQGL